MIGTSPDVGICEHVEINVIEKFQRLNIILNVSGIVL